MFNGFCDAIIRQASRKEISVSPSAGTQQHTVSLVISHTFLLGKEGYPVEFFLNIPFLETTANRASPVIKEISIISEDDSHHNNSGLRFIKGISVSWQETYLWSLANDGLNP